MILDLLEQRTLPEGDCDVCVLGAGPAGISTALELSRARPDWRIVLAEAGDRNVPDPNRNDPYLPAGRPESNYPVAASRMRLLGGTSNHWGGWCRPMDPEDFQARAHLPLSGWPLAREALLPYYRDAGRWCQIDSDDYDAQPLLADEAEGVLDVAGSTLLCHKLFRFSPPTRFGERYHDDLAASANLSCWLNACALRLELADGRAAGVHFGSPAGPLGMLKATRVVVAMGGLESTRFLLMHQRAGSRDDGLGSPMLGRCFADHLGFAPARALLPARLSYTRRPHESGPLMPVLAFRPEAQQALELANIAITTHPLGELGQLDPDYPHNPMLGFRDGDYWAYRLHYVVEPQANPDSRILLSDERDRHGLPRLQVDWRMHPGDAERGLRCNRELGAELGRLGLGRLKPLADEDAFHASPTFVFHHMGSTRMADSAEGGVVDAGCRVHGMENLHVVSSSVFPAYGFSNPTLTIVALGIRLARALANGAGA